MVQDWLNQSDKQVREKELIGRKLNARDSKHARRNQVCGRAHLCKDIWQPGQCISNLVTSMMMVCPHQDKGSGDLEAYFKASNL